MWQGDSGGPLLVDTGGDKYQIAGNLDLEYLSLKLRTYHVKQYKTVKPCSKVLKVILIMSRPTPLTASSGSYINKQIQKRQGMFFNFILVHIYTT